jgi:DNA invertase Pin-like site-specific DNA recombinase
MFDVLLVWKLDRLDRSLKDLINTLDELGALGIDFISYAEPFAVCLHRSVIMAAEIGCKTKNNPQMSLLIAR